MNRPQTILSITFFFSICLMFVSATFAQTDPRYKIEPNHEAVLHVVLGSSEAAQDGGLPQSLSGISKQLRANFAFTNYKLVNTYLGRIANTGNLDYKSIANIYAQEPETDTPSFLDWRLIDLRSSQSAAGQNVFQIQSFRFGARVPIKSAGIRDESGKSTAVINYESVGLTLDKISFSENSPTLIGTLSLPKPSGTMFLVLTVKGVGN
ncbi:hypothetical protein BH18ACI3_BH18ACI3_00190 [soil metagenome]